MEVEFNVGLAVSNPVSQPSVSRESVQPAASAMSFENTQALEQTLNEIPTVRPETVERAAALLSNAGYPSDEVLDRVAAILSQSINSQQA